MEVRPHDLLRLSREGLEVPDDAPAWAARELTREEPWVVVRRADPEPGMAAVGLRGSVRRERWALSVSLSCVRERVTPEALAWERSWKTVQAARGGLPALADLEAVARLLEGRGLVWGPGGSVGYELASGLPAVTENSDLDLILRLSYPLPRADARKILDDVTSLSVRVDAQVDIGAGSFALAEWAAGGEVLLRRAQGPILTKNPWGEPVSSRAANDFAVEGHRP